MTLITRNMRADISYLEHNVSKNLCIVSVLTISCSKFTAFAH